MKKDLENKVYNLINYNEFIDFLVKNMYIFVHNGVTIINYAI